MSMQMKKSREPTVLSVNRSMPSSEIIPVLAYPDVRDAVDWLCRAFGFTERLRIGSHRAQLNFGSGSIVIAGGRAEPGTALPAVTGCSVMVRVRDADRHHERAVEAGATIISPPGDYPYGERQYTALDPGGHQWTFTQTVADMDPADWGGELLE